MSDPVTLLLAALLLAWMAGVALGALFFGGLWWTVRAVVSAKRPALLVFGSLLLRTSVTLVGFYVASGGRPDRMIACLVGFVMARHLVTRLTRSWAETELPSRHEASHAP